MIVGVLLLLNLIVLHVAGPFPSFFKWRLVHRLTPLMIASSLGHAIVEEFIFRYLYWTMLPPGAAARHRTSLVYLNVTLFWLLHVLLLYHSRLRQHDETVATYQSTSYNVSLIFFALSVNAIFLESTQWALARCIALHAIILIVWTACLGGGHDDYLDKYQMPHVARRVIDLFGGALSDARRTVASARLMRGGR